MMNFVIVDDGEYFRTGEIIQTVAEEFCLVRFDDMSGEGVVMPAEMVYLAEMCETCPHGIKRWAFFDTPNARKTWWALMSDRPSKPKPAIVTMDGKIVSVDGQPVAP